MTDTTTPSLTDFLLDRIAEDEDRLRDVLAWRGSGTDHPLGHPLDPARVLAECEAKRRIVADVALMPENPALWGVVAARELVAHYLAGAYADHPDYRDEWRP